MYIKKTVLIFIILSLFNICLCYAHPHPVMEIAGKENEIIIYSLHWQVVDLNYLRTNFILEDCNYNIFMQDPFKYYDMETYIFIYHNCSKLKILNNTLFEDYWGGIPLMITISGFEGYPNFEEINNSINETKVENIALSIKGFNLPNNPLILFPLLILVGIFFALSGDFFNLFIPISLVSKYNKDKFLWLKAGTIHLLSTYVVVFLALDFIKKFFRFVWILIIFIGISMILENYLEKKNISPLIIAIIPCSASIFIFSILNNYYPILSYTVPLLMGLGEIITLKVGNIIPCPKKIVKYVPFLMIICGIIVAIKTFI